MQAVQDDHGFGTTHIDDDSLELYALGRIRREDQLAAIEEHLLVCELCRNSLMVQQEFVRTIRAVLQRW